MGLGPLPFVPRLVIFDLDGTLVDSLGDISAAMNHALARHGFPTHPPADYLPMVGDGAKNLVARAVAPEQRPEVLARVYETYQAYYLEHPVDHTRLYPAILSNKPDDATQQVVSRLLGEWKFGTVRGERPPLPRKPNPQVALEIARALKVEPASTGFLGDTSVDMKTAVAAGMWPCGVLWGFRGRDELTAHGAQMLLEQPSDLLNVLRPPG
jgi:phosphoglycolate phosphatase